MIRAPDSGSARRSNRHQQGDAAPAVLGRDRFAGQGGEVLQGDRLVGPAQIEQFMAHPPALLGAGLCGADVHLAVELARIDRQHRQVEGLRQLDRQGGLAAGGGSHQGDHQGRWLGPWAQVSLELGHAGQGSAAVGAASL